MRYAQDGSGFTINFPTVDWAKLIPEIVGLFFNAVGVTIRKSIDTAFAGFWSSSGNVIGQTPIDMVWGYGPVRDVIADLHNPALAILTFAVVLLGLRNMLGGLISNQHYDAISGVAGGVLPAVIFIFAFPLMVPQAIGLVNTAATAVGNAASVGAYVGASGEIADPLLSAILMVILVFFAVRLLIKAVWRVGFLAVLLPVGLLACALYAVPQSRWILGWWSRLWGGMLLAQIPSVFALSIGAGLALGGHGGIHSFVYSIAFMQLATDLYSIIPFGHAPSSGAPWGGALGRVGWLAASSMGGGAVSAGAAAASMRSYSAMQSANATQRYYGYD